MGIEMRTCQCGQEYETSEWVAGRECPDCAPDRNFATFRTIQDMDAVIRRMTMEQLRTMFNTRMGGESITGSTIVATNTVVGTGLISDYYSRPLTEEING